MPSDPATLKPSEWKSRAKLTLAILFVLSIVTAAASALLPPMTSVMVSQLGVPSDDWIGYIVTSFQIISGLAALPWAIVADRGTRRTLLIISTFFWIFWFIPLVLLNNTYLTLMLFYCIAAAGIGATAPLGLSMVIDCVPTRLRSTAVGLLGTAAGAGFGLGFIVSGLLVETFGWQTPFQILIVLGLGAGLLLFFTREPLRGQHEESLADLHSAGEVYTYRIKRSDLRRMWRKRSNIWLVLVGIIAIIPTAAFGAWAVRWLQFDHGVDVIFVATQFMTLALVSQIGGNIVFGRLGDRIFSSDKKGRAKLILLCCLCAGPILLLACFYPFSVLPSATIFDLLFNPVTLIFFLLVFTGTFFDAGISPLIYVSAGDVNPPEIRSTSMSIHLLAHVVGVALGTQLAPSLAVLFFGGTYSPSLALICLLFFAGALLTLPVLRHITQDIKQTGQELRERASGSKSV